MTTIETQLPAPALQTERAVFVSDGKRRARGLRYVAAICSLLACLWLAALVVGMLGLGTLPGVSLPIAGVSGEGGPGKSTGDVARSIASQGVTAPGTHASTMPARGSAHAAAAQARRSEPQRARASAHRAVVPVAARRRTRTGAQPGQVVQPPAPPAAAVAPTAVHRGWTRRGWAETPGQSRQAQQPVPATPAEPTPGRGPLTTTTPVTTASLTVPVLPPGQQKKADEPAPTG